MENEKEITLSDMYSFMQKQFGELNEKLTGIQGDLKKVKENVDSLEEKVKVLEEEKAEMKADIVSLKESVVSLQGNVNDREQYARSWSLRITGLNVPKEDIEKLGTDRACMKYSYDKILKPILTAAKSKGQIETVPSAYHLLLENGHHVFPRRGGRGQAGQEGSQAGAGDGGEGMKPQAPQIIVRFCSRHMRNVVLRNKKLSTPSPTTAEVAAGVKRYGIYEDLTAANFKLLREAINDERVSKAWTIDGKLRFIEKDHPNSVKSLRPGLTIDQHFKPK